MAKKETKTNLPQWSDIIMGNRIRDNKQKSFMQSYAKAVKSLESAEVRTPKEIRENAKRSLKKNARKLLPFSRADIKRLVEIVNILDAVQGIILQAENSGFTPELTELMNIQKASLNTQITYLTGLSKKLKIK